MHCRPLAAEVHGFLRAEHPPGSVHIGLNAAILQASDDQHRQITPPATLRAMHLIERSNELASHCCHQNQ